jgi:hypothetical protein
MTILRSFNPLTQISYVPYRFPDVPRFTPTSLQNYFNHFKLEFSRESTKWKRAFSNKNGNRVSHCQSTPTSLESHDRLFWRCKYTSSWINQLHHTILSSVDYADIIIILRTVFISLSPTPLFFFR